MGQRSVLANPDLAATRTGDFDAFVAGLPGLAATVAEEDVIYRGRNLLFRTRFADRTWVVKCFRLKNPLKRLLYRFRRPKALRSFEAAVRLGELGFGTPTPLVALSLPTGPLAGIYACELLAGWRQVRDLHDPAVPRRLERIAALGAWLGRLHEAGVLHRDGTVGNILFDPAARVPDWRLVDLNRVRFGPVSARTGVGNLVKLEQRGEMGEALLTAYCEARGLEIARWRKRYARWLWRHLALFVIKNKTRKFRRALNPFR